MLSLRFFVCITCILYLFCVYISLCHIIPLRVFKCWHWITEHANLANTNQKSYTNYPTLPFEIKNGLRSLMKTAIFRPAK